MTISAAEMEATRIARFDKISASGEVFGVQALPKSQIRARKILDMGIPEDPARRPILAIEHPFALGVIDIPPGMEVPLHSHTTEEVFFILEGTLTFFWGDDAENTAVLGKYDLMTMPFNTYRGFRNDTDTTVRMLGMVGGTNGRDMHFDVSYPPHIAAQIEAAQKAAQGAEKSR